MRSKGYAKTIGLCMQCWRTQEATFTIFTIFTMPARRTRRALLETQVANPSIDAGSVAEESFEVIINDSESVAETTGSFDVRSTLAAGFAGSEEIPASTAERRTQKKAKSNATAKPPLRRNAYFKEAKI